MIKEIYLTLNGLNHEISNINQDIDKFQVRKRNWDGSINQSALIVTDLQNYFLSPDSHAFIPSAPAIIPNIQKLADLFRDNNRPVIYTKHINSKENAGCMAYWWNDLIDPHDRISEIYKEFSSDKEIVIVKNQYDAFYNTELENILLHHNVLYPVICGVMANLCCETTSRSAFVRGFRPVMPVDATAAYNREFHLATFRNLAFGFSPLITTREVMDKLRT